MSRRRSSLFRRGSTSSRGSIRSVSQLIGNNIDDTTAELRDTEKRQATAEKNVQKIEKEISALDAKIEKLMEKRNELAGRLATEQLERDLFEGSAKTLREELETQRADLIRTTQEEVMRRPIVLSQGRGAVSFFTPDTPTVGTGPFGTGPPLGRKKVKRRRKSKGSKKKKTRKRK